MEEWITQFEFDISHTATVYDISKEKIKRSLIKEWKKDLKRKKQSEETPEANAEDLNIITHTFDNEKL